MGALVVLLVLVGTWYAGRDDVEETGTSSTADPEQLTKNPKSTHHAPRATHRAVLTTRRSPDVWLP
jgi:hypothetical protein